MEKFLEQDKINWINDSKATNIDSTISAIKSLEGKIILILGGRSKTNNYAPLKQVLDDKILRVIIYGECKEILKKELSGNNNIDVVENVHEAVKIAKKYADYSDKISGVTVLLSPACSSYDMFKSYEERGIHFKKNVMEIYR
jgi:UDP-N-acetylmuramoylalanine--D-glutamate ligase